MKKRGNATALAAVAALLSAALLLACGAAGDDRKMLQALSGETTPAATVVGMKSCVQCHYTKASEWLQTPHANLDPNNPTNLNYAGNPAIGSLTPGACTNCHDPDADSANQIAGVTGASGVFRPVVGCEACHGGGSNHYGKGLIGPYRVAATTIPTPLTTAAAAISVEAKTTGDITINTQQTTGTTTLSVTAPNAFTRAAGSFTTNGFIAGMTIVTSGFANAANNGTFTIQSVTSTKITITGSSLVTETGDGNELIMNTGNTDRFTRPAGSFLTNGFVAGMTITTIGFTDPANNGTFTIKSVTATTLVITASSLVAEPGAGVDERITATNTFKRTAGSFVADGFAAGMVITTSGFTGVNNGTFTILRVADNVADSTIEVTTSTLAAEPSGGDEVITSSVRTVTSAQFATCTACHELADAGGVLKATATHRAGGAVLPADNTDNITDTHFAEAGDFRCDDARTVFTDNSQTINCNDVAGYAIDFSSEKACTNCHAVHKDASVMNVNREWAASRHAEKSYVKAWSHYNWSCDGTTAESCGTSTSSGLPSSRTSCQRCHTTTGLTVYLDALRARNTSLANSIANGEYRIPNFFTPGFKPEMLQCSGCHSDNTGTLRDPGAYNAPYGGTVTYQYADLGGSNICLSCHAGRKSGDYINTLSDKFKTGRPIRDVEAHYLAAGGTMFAAAGYEYPNRNYASPTSFKHDKIGTSALSIDSGTNGPCVGCHMYRSGAPGNHFFRALNVSGGIITGITSDICFTQTCHPGSNFALTEIAEDEKTKFEYALEVFSVQLATANFKPYTTSGNTDNYIPLSNITSPYFGTSPTPPGVNVVWDAGDDTGNTVGKMNIGAAFNFLLLHDDPGAYVHNSKYAKRLIYDSLDWLDDKLMNYSVGASLPGLTYAPLTALAKTEAQAYLLPYGSLWTGGVWNSNPALSTGYGNPAERP